MSISTCRPFYGLPPDISPPKRRGVFVFIFFLPRRIAGDAFTLLHFFYFYLVKRYSVANASLSSRIYRFFCFLLLTSPASSSILKRAACHIRLAALFTGFRPTFHRRSGAAFSFLSFFFRAASPVTRLPCFTFFIFTSSNAIPSQTLPFPPVFIASFAFCSLQVRPVAPY